MSKALVAPVSRLDRLFAENPAVGVATGFAILAALVIVTVYLGGITVEALDSTIAPLVNKLVLFLEARRLPRFIVAKTIEGLYGEYAAALPYVFASPI